MKDCATCKFCLAFGREALCASVNRSYEYDDIATYEEMLAEGSVWVVPIDKCVCHQEASTTK